MDVPPRRWVFDKAKVVMIISIVISTNFEACQGGILDKITNRVGIDSVLDNYGTPSVRPDEDGVTTVVNMGMRLTRLHSVEEINMQMDSTLILYASWYDQKLLGNKLYKDVTNVIGESVDKIWKPDVYFTNGKNVDYDKVPTEGRIVKVITDETLTGVFYIVRLHLISSCPMSLELFPFDKQHCSINISSTGYTSEEVRFQWFNESESHGIAPVEIDLSRLAQFRVSPNIAVNEYYVISELDQQNVSCVSTTITLQRDPVYYFWSYYLPSMLVVMLSWVNFYIDVDAAPARISLGTTLVLTAITLIYTARAALPKIAYPTAMTVWLDAQGIFVILALVEYALSHQLNYQHKLQTMIGQRKKEKEKNKEEKCEEIHNIKESQNMYYMSGYTKDIYEEYHMETTHTGGSTIISGIIDHIAHLFRRDRSSDYAENTDSKEGMKKKQAMGKYRWWALEIDYISRFLFPAVYFTGVAAYVLSYRVWEVFLTEMGLTE